MDYSAWRTRRRNRLGPILQSRGQLLEAHNNYCRERARFAAEPFGEFGVVRPRLLFELTCLARRDEPCERLLEVELRLLPPTGERRFANGEPDRRCCPDDAWLSFFERRFAWFPSSSSRVIALCRYERAAFVRECVVSASPEDARP
jgi:hypothetical protein